ncbi:MAG: transglutaminase domain-containing protein [Pedosphaera sp.]|nr:transglutaminase domain-containing protein [Pedosphaera sp.]
MKVTSFLLAGIMLLSFVATGLTNPNAQSEATRLEQEGRFQQAASALTTALAAGSLAAAERKELEFELDRLDRIRKDYKHSKDALFNELKASVKDLSAAEFEKWIAEGRFDSREIDGERRFVGSSVSNLYFRYPALEARRLKPKDTTKFEADVLAAVRAIKQAALAEKKSYVLPKRFRNTMVVTAKADAAPDGEIVRAWLPIPRQLPFQTDFQVLSAKPATKEINNADSFIRAALLEAPARKGKPTQFKLEYEYTAYGVHFEIKPDDVKPVNAKDPALAPWLRPTVHAEFTPEIHQLSTEIVGDETNDFRKAKKCYDWIADQIKYSFAIEYSTIRNISEYCRTKRYGDCGQEALLFITLCRLNGIPARWQSGWNTFPGGKDIHDWTEIYLAPYGWMPVDPYMGIWAMRYARKLTPEQQREVRDFYFGGLDQWRMIANSDHSQTLSPPKNSMRSDNVDFQRGELEWGNHNLYFDKYSYDLEVKEVPVRSYPVNN